MKTVDTKTHILNCIDDLVTDLLFYNRKNDNELPLDMIEDEIQKGTITIEEMVNCFDNGLRLTLNNCIPHDTRAMEEDDGA